MNLSLFNVFSALFIFGVVVAFLGTIKLQLAEKLNINDTQLGGLISLNQGANFLGILVSGGLSLGYKWVLGVGFLIIMLAIGIMKKPQNLPKIAIAVFILGFGGSFLNVGANALLPLVSPENTRSILNLAHASFGFGALFLPLFLSYLFTHYQWKQALNYVIYLISIPTLLALINTYPPLKPLVTPNAPIMTHPLLGRVLLISFCYVGIEAALGIWITTYLKKVGWNEITASSLLSLFWLALMVTRLGIGAIITASNSQFIFQVVSFSLGITILGMSILLNRWLGLLSVILLGASCAPIFPTLVGITFAQFDSSLSAHLYSLLAAAGMLGSSLIPFLVGKVSTLSSIEQGIKVLIIPASCVLVLSFYL